MMQHKMSIERVSYPVIIYSITIRFTFCLIARMKVIRDAFQGKNRKVIRSEYIQCLEQTFLGNGLCVIKMKNHLCRMYSRIRSTSRMNSRKLTFIDLSQRSL